MGWEMILAGIIFVVIGVVRSKMNMNQRYTAGKALFKSSDGNIERDNTLDFSDQNYYDNKGILK